jgi:LPXTG-motif cell wall-anchored protein
MEEAMKTLIKTSVFVLALAGIVAIMTGTAAAAPYDKAHMDQELAINQHDIVDMSGIVVAPVEEDDEDDQPSFPDGGDDECVGCDDEDDQPSFPDGGDDECVGCDDDEGLDDGGDDEGVVDDEENPPVDEDEEEEQTPPTTDSGKKLPNTGTQLAIIGGIGLLAALAAITARFALRKKMR